jgi:uncharacterized membrane protein YeaQ/YmgE (transglycosylase-associated protein family)
MFDSFYLCFLEERQGYYNPMDILHFAFYIVVSALCAGLATTVLPGGAQTKTGSAFLYKALVGIIGAWLGDLLIGPVGPSLEGVRLLPALVGSFLLVLLLSLTSSLLAVLPGVGKSKGGKRA